MTDTNDLDPEEIVLELDENANDQWLRDRDGVASLRDTEAESGDEEELVDAFDLDELEAREVGAQFEGGVSDEPRLD